jgi:hypothetical protein
MAKLGRQLGILANCVLLLGAALCAGLLAFLVWRHGMSLRYLVFVGLAVSTGARRTNAGIPQDQ